MTETVTFKLQSLGFLAALILISAILLGAF
jgi:hypothetical protein